MQLLPWHPPTHIHYSVSAQWRWREGYSFVNATPIHVNALPPPQNVRHTSLCALLPHPCLSCSPFLFHYVRWDKKHLICYKKKKEEKKHKRAGQRYDSHRKLDSRLLKPSYWNVLRPHLPTAGWMQGLHIKVLVAFRGEGQGFDWAGLLNWAQNEHRHSKGQFTGCSHCMWGRALCYPHRQCYEQTAAANCVPVKLQGLRWSRYLVSCGTRVRSNPDSGPAGSPRTDMPLTET